MSRTRVKLRDRFLAALLSVLMIFAMIPVTSLQAFAAEGDYYRVKVNDGTNPVEGATVTITSEHCPTFEMIATTDATGVAAFSSDELMTKIQQTVADPSYVTVKITETITKEGYEDLVYTYYYEVDKGSEITITKSLTPLAASISVAVTGDATVEVNGVAQNAVTVPVGTDVPVKITPAAGSYIKSLTVGGETIPVTKGEAYSGTVKVDTNVGRICVRLGWVPLQPLPESLQLHLLEM